MIPSSSRTTHSSRWWPEASYPSRNHRRRARRAHSRGGTSGAPPCPWSTPSEAAQRGGPPRLPEAGGVHQGGGGRWRTSRPCCAGRTPKPLHRGEKERRKEKKKKKGEREGEADMWVPAPPVRLSGGAFARVRFPGRKAYFPGSTRPAQPSSEASPLCFFSGEQQIANHRKSISSEP